jgi:hypothetical protein
VGEILMAEHYYYQDDGYLALEEEPVDISEATPRILLMGGRRSGKSSLAGVVFNKLPPHEALFMESTGQLDIKYVANNAFVQFQVWDFPGNFDFEREELVYAGQIVSAEVGGIRLVWRRVCVFDSLWWTL